MSLTTWTSCMKITRSDGVIMGLTELDKDITFESQLYEAATSGYSPTTLQGTADLSVNNADTEGVLTITGITKEDIVAGLFDHASVEFFILDYKLNTKVRDLGKGNLGEVTLTDGRYSAEYRSLTQVMQQTIGKVYTAECDATLGDSRCGVDLAPFTVSSSVTSVTTNSSFTDSARVEADDYFNYGLVTFTSGLNNGQSQEIKAFSAGVFVLHLPMPYAIAATDTYDVYAGCNKTKAICISKFNNVVNFRGFDMIPGQDQALKFGGQ